MADTYTVFFSVFLFILIVCTLVGLAMAWGIKKDFALQYDLDYLWSSFADSKEELIKKIELHVDP